jgi:hypothetical protein
MIFDLVWWLGGMLAPHSDCPSLFIPSVAWKGCEPHNFYRVGRPQECEDKWDISDLKGRYSLQPSQSHATFLVGNCFAKERTNETTVFCV